MMAALVRKDESAPQQRSNNSGGNSGAVQ